MGEEHGLKSTLTKAYEFAASWIEAWNSHDLDRIAGHYSEDAVLSSPFVRTIVGGDSNSIRGRVELLSYFRAALHRFPSLHFRLRAVYAGDEAIVLLYDSVNGLVATEKLKLHAVCIGNEAVILLHDSVNGLVATEKLNLNEKGQIVRVWAYYGRVKQSNAAGR